MADLETKLSSLDLMYARASADISNKIRKDNVYLDDVRAEAGQIVALLRGGALFGRYSSDADHHMVVANKWRRSVLASLLGGFAVAIVLYLLGVTDWRLIGIGLVPSGAIALYASIESQNHRRRELDRRRIALRMAAIESYMAQQWGTEDERERLMHDFIREHFIEPALDSNDLSYFAPTGRFFAMFGRGGRS